MFLVVLGASDRLLAEELCGENPNAGTFASGFEAGELPWIPEAVLPSQTTPLGLVVDGPAEGSTIDAARVQVFGSFTGPPNSSVTVDGVPAYKVGTRWLTVVELLPGSNVLAVKVRNMAGAEVSVALTLVRGAEPFPPDPVQLDAVSRIAPFTTTGRYDLPGSVSGSIDFDGDGQDDASAVGASAALAFLYTQPGLYRVRFTLQPGGTFHRYLLAEHPSELRQTFCYVFGHMRERLIAGDIPGALSALVPELQPRFQSLWTGLGGNLASTAQGLGQIIDGRYTRDTVELLLARPNPDTPGSAQLFQVQMARGSDGIWRIVAM
ncbi:MAG: hypothetical protein AB7I68_14880 [Porticoccaceae bacterium]